MITASTRDYAPLDHPSVLASLFHPRSNDGAPDASARAVDAAIPVADDAVIGARFHLRERAAPSLLFFHGNGEIADDYDDLGSGYNRANINFLAVDYRGYGRSTGRPTSSAMMRDCHAIFAFVTGWLADNRYDGPLILMGRSLGSASALELAAGYQDRVAGLIIESGFAYTMPLFRLIGIDAQALGFEEADGFGNLDKIRSFIKPTLIVHAERDHIIPFAEAEALYAASAAADKRLLQIPRANHNNLLTVGFPDYMDAIESFVASIA